MHASQRRCRGVLAALLVVAPLASQAPDPVDAFIAAAKNAVRKSSAHGFAGAHRAVARVLAAHARIPKEARTPNNPAFRRALRRIGRMFLNHGRTAEARPFWSRLVQELSASNPDEDPRRARQLAWTQSRLGLIDYRLGDYESAGPLFESAYALLGTGTHAIAEPDAVQKLRSRLVQTRLRLGDDSGAIRLQESSLATERRRGKSLNDPAYYEECRRLGRMQFLVGQVYAAYDVFERLYRFADKNMPEDSDQLQQARHDLAFAMETLGDFPGALDLARSILAARSRSSASHPRQVLVAQQDVGVLLAKTGDLQGARQIQRTTLAKCKAQFASGHLRILRAEQHLAATLYGLGDLPGARALQRSVYDALLQTHPTDERKLQLCRTTLGRIERELGHLTLARSLHESAYEQASRIFPTTHPRLQASRHALLITSWQVGDLTKAVRLALESAQASRARIASTPLAARATGELARQEQTSVSDCLHLALTPVPPTKRDALLRDAFWNSQILRGLEMRVARRTKQAPGAQLVLAKERILTAMASGDPRFGAVVRDHDHEERQLRLRVRARRGELPLPTIDAIAAGLPVRSAAAAVVRFTRRQLVGEPARKSQHRDWLAGLVLRRSGAIRLVDLGPLRILQERVAHLRAATRKELRHALLDPLLAAAGKVETLFVALDELLELVPLDALPLHSGEPFGSHVQLRRLASLLELARTPDAKPANKPANKPALVAIGGLDYGKPPAAPTASAVSFAPLAESRREARHIADVFHAAHPAGTFTLLDGATATKQRLQELAPEATFLHFATHGYFARTHFTSGAPVASPWDAAFARNVQALSPLVLCGLALSNANRARAPSGRTLGIITAEELLSLDLRQCYLAVLSACDSFRGVRRFGQGHASLHTALHGAGARFVLSSRWQVGDTAARRLMAEFYERLWKQGDPPAKALWAAKMAARRRGAAFEAWAGWVLSGR